MLLPFATTCCAYANQGSSSYTQTQLQCCSKFNFAADTKAQQSKYEAKFSQLSQSKKQAIFLIDCGAKLFILNLD